MPFHKKISRIVRKAIPKEIAPFVAPVAGMALGPMAGSFLGGLGGTLAAKGGIGSLVGKALSNQMVSQGLGRALVDVGTQALTSDRISPASALLSGGLGALSGYEPLTRRGPNYMGNPSKFRIGLDKALKQGAKLGRVGNLGEDFDLLAAAKMANVGGTLKAADDELAAEKKRQAIANAKNQAFFEADNATRRQNIIEAMMRAGFTKFEGEQAAAEEGYAMGGRVGFEIGGGVNEEDIAEYMAKIQTGELVYDPETDSFIPAPRKRRRQNTRPADNEEMMFDLMRRMELNRMGRKDGGKVPGLPAGRQVDAREGTFIPMGGAKRADDVPAMLSVNEFVLNDDAVAGLGKLMTGSPDPRAGARALYRIQDQLEAMV